jgi:hypothetical protein
MNFRKSIIGGLTALTLGSCSPQTTEADKFYQDFPATQLNGSVTHKYKVEGAKHCLVHILQDHYAPPPLKMDEAIADPIKTLKLVQSVPMDFLTPGFQINPDPITAYRDIIRMDIDRRSKSQAEIYSILTFLQKNYGVTAVRSEGATRDQSPTDCLNLLNSRNLQLLQDGFITKEDLLHSPKYTHLSGADLFLGLNGLSIRATEDVTTYSKALEEMTIASTTKNLTTAQTNLIQNGREDVVLKMISTAGEPYSVVIYGYYHDFLDNVNNWNIKHSNDKFSLIVVTPKTIKEKLKLN